MVPKGWKKSLLSEGIELISGRHIPAADCTNNPKGTPYLTGPEDFCGRNIQATKFVTEPQVMCENGDILITVKGSGTGRSVRADGRYCISRQLMAIRSKMWCIDFLAIVVEQQEAKYGNSALGLIPGISRLDILETPILLPPLPEQKKIAVILSAWDRAIALTEKLIAAKQKLKKGLMQQLLTGKRRFAEFVKSRDNYQTHFGPRPSDWPHLHIGEIASEVSERAGSENGYPVLSCTKYGGLVDSLQYFGKRIFSEDTSEYKLVRRGHFAYATNHIEEGSIGLLTDLKTGLVSPMYTVFKTGQQVHPPFLYMLFKTELYRHIFEVKTNASVNRRGSLRWSQFAKIYVALPSIKEQHKIAEVIGTSDREITLLQEKLEVLKQQKRGLMQKLLTGKIRVKIDDEKEQP